jgi:hypothetical protein
MITARIVRIGLIFRAEWIGIVVAFAVVGGILYWFISAFNHSTPMRPINDPYAVAAPNPP